MRISRLPWRWEGVAPVLGACVIGAIVLGSTHLVGGGAELDEGSLLAYPSRVVRGDLPYRDFVTFYGPANPFLLAGVYEVFGYAIEVERAVGLGERLVVVGCVVLITVRLSDPWLGLVAGLVCAMTMINTFLWAVAWFPGLALGLVGAAILTGSIVRSEPSPRIVLLAGFALGASTLFRFDLLPAILAVAITFGLTLNGRRRVALAGGLCVSFGLYAVFLAVVGQRMATRTIEELQRASSASRVPMPEPTDPLGRLFWLSATVSVGMVIAGAVLSRRRDRSGPPVLAVGLFLLLLHPYVLSRPDDLHVLSVGCAALGFAPLLLHLGVGRLLPVRWARHRAPFAVLGVVCVMAMGEYVFRTVAGTARDRLAHGAPATGYAVVRGDRSFPIADEMAGRNIASIVAALDARSRPGDTLYVGLRNLSVASYSDTFLYYLFPDLEPATRWLELNPMTANAPGSSLVDDLQRTDYLVLTTRYDDAPGLKTRQVPGPDAPNRVVERLFCRVRTAGTYELLQRCAAIRADARSRVDRHA